MANYSKQSDERQWAKWKRSGAVESIVAGELRSLPVEQCNIVGTCLHYAGPASGYYTLSMGRKVIHSGPDCCVSQPAMYAMVPATAEYKPGQVLDKMPVGALPLSHFFPETC